MRTRMNQTVAWVLAIIVSMIVFGACIGVAVNVADSGGHHMESGDKEISVDDIEEPASDHGEEEVEIKAESEEGEKEEDDDDDDDDDDGSKKKEEHSSIDSKTMKDSASKKKN